MTGETSGQRATAGSSLPRRLLDGSAGPGRRGRLGRRRAAHAVRRAGRPRAGRRRSVSVVISVFLVLRAVVPMALLAATWIAATDRASAHSVGLRNTRVFLDPDVAAMLTDRAASSGQGVQPGDILEYVVEFEPYANGADVGPGGWVTFYIPPFARVVGASFVTMDGGDFVDIPLPEPGEFYDGVGPGGDRTPYGAPFASAVNGSLAQLYGDVGIFYSTDPRTAKFVGGADPATTPLGNNGYAVDPTGCGQLIPAGWDNCWAHNAWDRDMTFGFGTGGAGTISTNGRNNTPYLAGSPVAGPDTYYNLDYTATVGPWQRITYPGSLIGTGPAPNPAITPGPLAPSQSTAWVPVTPGVNDGIVVDAANPLPANTNAVRFAIGRLEVLPGTDDYMWVKVALEVESAPAQCSVVDGEVFGGDAAAIDSGKDNMWRYMVPIAALNNTCIAISKAGPATVAPSGEIQYEVSFANVSPTPLTNVVVSDALDPATTFVAASNGGAHSGGVVTWPTVATLAPGEARTYTVTVTAPAAESSVVNEAVAFSDQTYPTSSVWETRVMNQPPGIAITKTPGVGSVTEPGDTVTFDVTVTNSSVEALTIDSLVDDVFGDLLDAGNSAVSANSCVSLPGSFAAGASFACSFDAFVAGDASGPDHTDTVTLTGHDAGGTMVEGADDATVSFLDAAPTIAVTKAASVASVDEPGDHVTFDVTVTNSSVEALTIDSLVDDVFGDLLDAGNSAVSANSCVSLPGSFAAGASFACSFDAFVAGDASGPDHTDTVTLTGHDAEGGIASDEASAMVAFDDVLPVASITKTASAASLAEPGGTVTFTATVANLSVEALTIGAVWDDVFGNLLDAGNTEVSANSCPTLPSSLAVGASATCSFQAALSGGFGDPDHVDTVTVTADDGDGNDIEVSDSATVAFAPSGSSLTGVVFADHDRDGVMDPGEPGLVGVGIHVTDLGGGGTVTATTGSDGHWSATVLPGSVDVRVVDATVPAGYDLTTANAHQTVAAVAGVAVAAANIGFGPLSGSISGQVYLDLDHSPDRDPGEPPLAGVTIDLLQSGAVVHSTVTDGEGHYSFINLPPGTYEVRIDGQAAPIGLEISVDPDAAVDGQTAAVVIAGAAVDGLDFGYTGTASVGDLVWEDRDGDGVKNEDEPTIAGATITMVWAGPDGVFDTADDFVFPSVTTDESGHYEFAMLPPGSYRLEIDSTTIGAATQATTPTVVTIELTAGDAVLTADFGFGLGSVLPFTGIAADQFLIAAVVLLLLGAAVLGDSHRRERRWDLAIWRVSGRR